MKTVAKKKLYEGMFLVDSALAGANWDGVIASITRILERAGAEIVSIKKWDERKLAYTINGKTRGTYILTYFNVDGGKVRDIEKAVQLSEQIMRVLILNAERMTKEDIEKETPADKAEKEKDKRKEDTEEEDEDIDIERTDDENEDEDEQDWEDTDDSEEDELDKAMEGLEQEHSKRNPSDDIDQADEQEQ